MLPRVGLFALLAALLGFGILWHCCLVAGDGGLAKTVIRLNEVGNRRALTALTALGHLSVVPDPTALQSRGTERTRRGVLEWSLDDTHGGPLPSTALARDALGTEFAFDAVSVAIDPFDWSDPDFGIFANPLGRGRLWERGACLSLFAAGQLAAEATVGIRIHGNTSRLFREKSLRLIFNPLFGIAAGVTDFLPGAMGRELVIRNQSRGLSFPSPIAFEFAALVGCDVPRTRPVRLLLNGVEQRDVYCLVERLGQRWLRQRLGHDQFVFVNHPAHRHPKEYRKQYLRIRDRRPTLMHHTAEHVDMDGLVNWLTAMMFCANWDPQQGLAYRDLADPDGRWSWTAWDMDFAFRPWPTLVDPLTVRAKNGVEFLMNCEGLRSLLFRQLMTDDPLFRERIFARISKALNHELCLPRLLDILTRYRAVANTYRSATRRTVLADMDQIEAFVRERPEQLRQELIECFDVGPVHRVNLYATADVVMRVDGQPVAGTYVGHYFAGQPMIVDIDGEPANWRLDDRPAGTGNRLAVAVDRDVHIAITR